VELFSGADRNATSVRLGTKSFGKDAALHAADVLKEMGNVMHADMSDIIAGRPEEEALEVLQILCGALPPQQLKELDLSENALGEKGIRALRDIISPMSGLEMIVFMNNGLSELSIRLLAEFLPTENLRVLHFHNNMSGPGGAKAAAEIIAKCPMLEDFRMSSSRVSAEGGLPLIQALCSLKDRIIKINLADSTFDDDCTQIFVQGLQKMANLADLILRDTSMDKDALFEVLSDPLVAPNLAVLDISGLEIDAESAETVGNLVASRFRLRKLWMDDNELESKGVEIFCKTIKGTNLELISVETNQIGQRGAAALAHFVARNPTITNLDLNDNQISINGLESVRRILSKAGKLSALCEIVENDADLDEDDDVVEEAVGDEVTADSLAQEMNTKLKLQ